MAASLITLKLLSDTLGPEGLGELGTVVATYVLLGALTDLGTGAIAVREMARAPERARSLVVTASRLRVALGVVAGLLGTARYLGSGLPETDAGLVGALFPVVQGWSSSRLYLQATRDHAGQVRATVLGRAAQVLLVAAAAWLGTGVRGAVAALVGGELAIAGLLRAEVGRLPAVELGESLRAARALAKGAIPLALAFVLTQSVESLDVLLLRTFRSLEETGIYSLAERPLAILDQAPRLVLWGVFSVLSSRAAAGDRDGLARAHRETTAALGLAAAPVAAGAWIVGPRLLTLLFGERFAAAGAPFVVLALGSAVSFVSAPAASLLVALGRTGACLGAGVVSFAIDLGLNALLIPRLGATGAAWAWVAARSAEAVFLHGAVYVSAGIAPPLASLARSSLAAVILLAALTRHRVDANALVLVAAGVAVYAIATVATGAVRIEEGRARVISES
jgi:O-antigen/teichoic acid export membrane protein